MVSTPVPVRRGVRARLENMGAAVLDRPVRNVFLIALVVRVVVALVINLSTDEYLIPDEGSFLRFASGLARGLDPDVMWPGYGQSYVDATGSYMWQIVRIFEVFGPQRILAQLPAVAYGSALAALTVRIALLRLRTGFAVGAGLVVALVPSQVLWSSVVLRESCVWLLLAVMAFVLARAWGERRWPVLLLVAAVGTGAFVLLTWLRLQTAVGAFWCFGIVFTLSRAKRSLRVVCAVVVLAAAPWSVGIGAFGLDFVGGAMGRLGVTRSTMGRWAESAFDYGDPAVDVNIGGRLESVSQALGDGSPVAAVLEAADMVRHATSLTDRLSNLDIGEAVELARLEAERARRAALMAQVEASAAGEAAARVQELAGDTPDEMALIAIEAADRAGRAADAAIDAAARAASAADGALEMVEVVQNVSRLASSALEGASRLVEQAQLESELGGAWTVLGTRVETAEPIEASFRVIHKGLYNTLVRPWPWNSTRNKKLLVSSFETPIWLALYSLAFVGAWRFRRDGGLIAFPVLLVAVIALGGAVSHGNLGTAFRHRGQILFALAILAMAGLQSIVDRREPSPASIAPEGGS